ncbi:MAG TPA: OsmC family peroxiredoxin [Gaiellaceae bacterium]|nr:OsmC family peroxiredoxin [Gaiellaceae bacterium]
MPRIERVAEAVWQGRSASGSGSISGRSSGAFDLAYSEPTRVGDPGGETSPEELIAAAHAGCFAMSLAAELTKLGLEPRRLSVTATCVMDEVEGRGHLVVASNLEVKADVPGVDPDAFHEAVERADAGCPISTLIRASASVSVHAEPA